MFLHIWPYKRTSLKEKKLVAQVLWPLSNIPALRYTIDQCLIPMKFILHSKRVI